MVQFSGSGDPSVAVRHVGYRGKGFHCLPACTFFIMGVVFLQMLCVSSHRLEEEPEELWRMGR